MLPLNSPMMKPCLSEYANCLQKLGTELYDHTADDTVANIAESVNVVAEPNLHDTVAALSAQLHAGWRHKLASIAQSADV